MRTSLKRRRKQNVVAVETLAPLIRIVRGHRVMFDADLARIYGVPTKRLIEQVKRNLDRFPKDCFS